MPRNMSFTETKEQVRQGRKTVTRRIGWWFIKPGDIVNAVEQSRGLKKGEKVKFIRQIRIVSTRPEPINALLKDVDYGFGETAKEGFEGHPEMQWPAHFVEFFCALNRCEPAKEINRIEFEYI